MTEHLGESATGLQETLTDTLAYKTEKPSLCFSLKSGFNANDCFDINDKHKKFIARQQLTKDRDAPECLLLSRLFISVSVQQNLYLYLEKMVLIHP